MYSKQRRLRSVRSLLFVGKARKLDGELAMAEGTIVVQPLLLTLLGSLSLSRTLFFWVVEENGSNEEIKGLNIREDEM